MKKPKNVTAKQGERCAGLLSFESERRGKISRECILFVENTQTRRNFALSLTPSQMKRIAEGLALSAAWIQEHQA